MSIEIIYDLVIREEIPAKNKLDALEKFKNGMNQGFSGSSWGVEVIRDDNRYPGSKDDFSRLHNGYVVLSSKQKHEMLNEIQSAFDEVKAGNTEAAEKLMQRLYNRFDYMEHRLVP